MMVDSIDCFPIQPRRKSSSTADRKWTPWLIPAISIANVAVFIVVMYINNCPNNHNFGSGKSCVLKFLGRLSFQPLRQNFLLGPSAYTLFKMGALQWDMVVRGHQGWRLITCIWLHGGLVHLSLNILSLLVIGIRLEQKFGFVRIGVLYLVSGVGGSVLSALFLGRYMSMGASGAIFGLLGAMLSELLVNWTIYNNKVVVLLVLVLLIVPNFVLGIIPHLHVDNFGHLGGFLTGFLLGFVVLLRPRFGWQERHQLPEHLRVKSKYLPYQLVLFVTALALLIAGYTVGMTMLFKGKRGDDLCKWCHYLNCVPSSRWKCN
ncbi:RHOMBOID-like protein 3 isoform X2 [Silene latifolia]|uniref:RHOMBOID-like protein 3 isoform X2 n=1 Tax=Silene latifolia TaxID=37657 RepID=UPI003D788886